MRQTGGGSPVVQGAGRLALMSGATDPRTDLRAALARVVAAYPELRQREARDRLAAFLACPQADADSLSGCLDSVAVRRYDNYHG